MTNSRLPFWMLASVSLPLFFSAAHADSLVAPSATVSFYRSNLGHTGVATEKLTAPLSLLWRNTTRAARDNPASAVYAAATAYFVSEGVVYAVNAADGSTKWQYPADGKAVSYFATTPAVVDGFLYLTDDNGQAYKIDTGTGQLVWRTKLEGTIRSAPVVSQGTVFFGSGNQHCYALSIDTGQTLWDFKTDGAITTSPTIIGGLVAFASSDNTVYGLNARTGHKVWGTPFDADPSIVPVVFDGSNLLVTAGDTVYYLNPDSGRQRTTLKLPATILIPPTVSEDTTYVITQSKGLYAVGTNGRVRWKAILASAAAAPPLLAGSLLLVPTQSGVLSGYDAYSGALVWNYVLQASATDSQPKASSASANDAPILADGTLYVVGDDGSLNAFRQDAPDDIAPQLNGFVPESGATVRSADLTYGASLVDLGSGINPATVTLQVDGQTDPQALYHPEVNAVYNTPTTPLAAGKHEISIKASDWRGNVTTQTWSFTVQDSSPQTPGRFNPFGPNFPGGGGGNPGAGGGAPGFGGDR